MKQKNIDDIANELRCLFNEYNGMPSGKESKSAYQKACYIFKRYGDEPSIRAILSEFNISTIWKYKQNGIDEIKAILMEHESVPSSSTEKTIYQRVKKFFYDHPKGHSGTDPLCPQRDRPCVLRMRHRKTP